MQATKAQLVSKEVRRAACWTCQAVPLIRAHFSKSKKPKCILRYCTVHDRAQLVRAEALDPDNASILVAGGGGVALSVTRRLKDMGSWVWMLQRSDSRRSVSI